MTCIVGMQGLYHRRFSCWTWTRRLPEEAHKIKGDYQWMLTAGSASAFVSLSDTAGSFASGRVSASALMSLKQSDLLCSGVLNKDMVHFGCLIIGKLAKELANTLTHECTQTCTLSLSLLPPRPQKTQNNNKNKQKNNNKNKQTNKKTDKTKTKTKQRNSERKTKSTQNHQQKTNIDVGHDNKDSQLHSHWNWKLQSAGEAVQRDLSQTDPPDTSPCQGSSPFPSHLSQLQPPPPCPCLCTVTGTSNDLQ